MSYNPEVIKTGGVYYIKGRPREAFTILSHHHPPNIPGKSLIIGLVTMPLTSATPPHTHGGSTVVGLTIQGTVLNQMNTSEPGIRKPGEMWYEAPGCHYVRGENVDETEAKFFAVFAVEDEVVKDG